MIEAVEAHRAALERDVARAEKVVADVLTSDETPDTATEVMRVLAARTSGEVAWARDHVDRVHRGAYAFLGEAPDWQPSEAQIATAVAGGALRDTRPLPDAR